MIANYISQFVNKGLGNRMLKIKQSEKMFKTLRNCLESAG